MRDRVKCVWETEAELECLLLMGLTLLFAVQPCCVGKRAVVCACYCQECFSLFVFILILSVLTVPCFFFPLHFSHFVCCLQSGSRQTWAPSFQCHLAIFRHQGGLKLDTRRAQCVWFQFVLINMKLPENGKTGKHCFIYLFLALL